MTHVQSVASTVFLVMCILQGDSLSRTHIIASLSIKEAIQMFQGPTIEFGHPNQVCVLYRDGNGCRGRSTNIILCSWNIKKRLITVNTSLSLLLLLLAGTHLYSSLMVTKIHVYLAGRASSIFSC